MPTIVLALVADVIGVFIMVFDVLLQDADMPEKCLTICYVKLYQTFIIMTQNNS